MPSHHYVRNTEFSLQVHRVKDMLGVSARTVRYWAESGKLPGIKNGPKLWCFRRADVERRRLEMSSEARSRAPRNRAARPIERVRVPITTARSPRPDPNAAWSPEVNHA